MWGVADVLLAVVLASSLAGFHLGPHTHAFASALGAVTAIWLIAMGLSGLGAPALWGLLAADVALSGAVGTLAWRGFESLKELPRSTAPSLEGALGTATDVLDPEGTVRVRGESWSATSLNGRVERGEEIQVVNAKGVRLEVWGLAHDYRVLAPPAPAISGGAVSDAPGDAPGDDGSGEAREHPEGTGEGSRRRESPADDKGAAPA
jgi:membrane protein implicated in regulation of membrane protease activity